MRADGLAKQRLAAGLTAVALLVAPAAAGQRTNVLDNGGFEDGLAGWQADQGHELVEAARQAHSGSACLSGAVTERNKFLRLRRTVAVRADNSYVFEIWARATNGTKLVLWVRQPGSQRRQMVRAWRGLRPRWTRYRTAVPVARSGKLELELIAPSAVQAPPGRIWIDDLALYETVLPPITNLSRQQGFNDAPAMAVAADGSLYVAWISFRKGYDSVQLARYRPQGKGFQPLGQWQVVGGRGCYVLGPLLAAAGLTPYLLFAAERDGNWDLVAVPCRPEGPGRPVSVTRHEAVDIKPAAAWYDGTLYLAWESNRNGRRQVFTARVRDGQVSEPEPVSCPAFNSYSPSVAVLPGGELCIAWHSFQQNNYDVWLRRRGPDGTWQPAARLTQAPSIDRHPHLFARGSELWLVYENAQTSGYRISTTNRRRLIVCRVGPRGLETPAAYRSRSPLYGRCEAGSAAFDRQGRLWLAYLTPRPPRSGWDLRLTCYSGTQWLEPLLLSASKGMDRRPGLAVCNGRVVVAFQGDNLPRTWSEVDRTAEATSDILLASIETACGPEPAALALEPLQEPDEPFEAGPLRLARGEDASTPTIDYGGRTLKLFYGDLHEHTDISVCNRLGDQSPDESYQCLRDIAALDFGAATDHGYNINPYLWSHSAKMARVNADPGRFLTFLAEEWTSSFEKYSKQHPYGFYGHRNLIFGDPYFPRWWNARNGQTPAQVWEQLRNDGANFVHIPHQLADTGNVPTDWNFTDETAQPVAELFQVRGSYEYLGAPRQAVRATPKPGYFIQDAWSRGIVIGVIASPDHGGGLGKACVYAPELSRQAVLEGLRARHCFGTTAARIFLDVRVNGHLMGEKLPAPSPAQPVRVQVRARCPDEIERVEVCRNNQFVFAKEPKGRQIDLEFVDMAPPAGRSYYYVRVTQKDGEIAWSSPVWLGY